MTHLFLRLAASLLLGGCSSVVPGTVARLSQVSPLTADPAGFVVALDLPDGVAVAPGSAHLILSARQTDTGEAATGQFTLEAGQTAAGQDTLRVAEKDLSSLRALQARINAWEDADPDATQGSLSVTLAGCRVGEGPDPDATLSIALQPDKDAPFLPLVRNAPLSDALKLAETGPLPPC